MSKIGLIIGLLYLVFHVLQFVLQAAAKRKEQERIRVETENRRLAASQMTAPKSIIRPDDGTGTGDPRLATGRSASPQPIRSSRPADDQANRRRAQLDELRTKRDGRRTVAAASPTRGAPTASSSRLQSSAALPAQVAIDERARLREAERQRVKREEEGRLKREQFQAAQRREDAETARLARERAKRNQAQQKLAAPEPRTGTAAGLSGTTVASVTRNASKSPSSAVIIDLLRTPGSVRQAMILREVLEKPLSLKDS